MSRKVEKISFGMMGKDGKVIGLREILDKLPENSWDWHILYIYGIGVPPSGETMDQFENKINISRNGLKVSMEYMYDLSNWISDIYDIEIFSTKKSDDIDRMSSFETDFSEYELRISAFDSAVWEIYATESNFHILKKFSDYIS